MKAPVRVSDVVRFMKDLAPLHTASEWDNVGLLLGDHQAEVSKLMTCLTLTPDVADEAIAGKFDLIVTHHPIFFKPAKSITTQYPDSRMIWNLARAGVGVFSAHTAYDNAQNGINDRIMKALDCHEVVPLRSTDTEQAGRYGSLKQKVKLAELAAKLKLATKTSQLGIVGDDHRLVQKIAVACGAAGEFLKDASRMRAEVFITGEMRFHDYLSAKASGVSLLLTGHYASERHGMEFLAEELAIAFPTIECCPSANEEDPIHYL